MAKKKKKVKQEVPPPQHDVAEGAVPEASADEQEAVEADESADEAEQLEVVEAPEPVPTQLLRLQADFENYRKRVLREKDGLYQRANADLLEELLPVLDHMDLAFQSASDADMDNAVVHGVKIVADQLVVTLSKFGLEAVDAEGIEFDPNVHEAISHLPSPDVAENFVVAQTRRGYKLGSRLLRAAQVVVSSGSPEPAADA